MILELLLVSALVAIAIVLLLRNGHGSDDADDEEPRLDTRGPDDR